MQESEVDTKKHDRNTERFFNWASQNPCCIQVNYPRSGTEWLSKLHRVITGKRMVTPYAIDDDNFSDYLMFWTHGFRWDYESFIAANKDHIGVVLVVRDPRDCALSSAYRWVNLKYPTDEYSFVTDEVLDIVVRTTAVYWQKTIDVFLPLSDVVISYEDLCLDPVTTLEKVYDLLSLKYDADHILQAVRSLDRAKRYIVSDGETYESLENHAFDDNLSRYQNYCGKWLNDPLFKPRYNQQISLACASGMRMFNYDIEEGVETNAT